MIDDIKFTCEQCGKDFDPDPDSMVELHWSPEFVSAEGESFMDERILTPEILQSMDAAELREIGLTPELRAALLRGEEITAGGMCICQECQDRMADDLLP